MSLIPPFAPLATTNIFTQCKVVQGCPASEEPSHCASAAPESPADFKTLALIP